MEQSVETLIIANLGFSASP